MEAQTPMNPDAGVIATRPTTAPEAAPIALVLPVCAQLRKTHHIAATAVAMLVFWNASVSKKPANPALPGLKPNQPNQSSVAPSMISGMECGSKGALPYPSLLPRNIALASPANPEVMWMTVPPAKSNAPRPPNHPMVVPWLPNDQFQCPAKSYTNVVHKTVKIINALIFTLSA